MMDYYLIILISVFVAVAVALVVILLTPKTEKEIVEERVTKYFKGSSIDDIEDIVMMERRIKKDERRGNRRFISKDLSEYIISSGIQLTPQEFILTWIGLIFVPMLLLSLLGVSLITIAAVALVGFLIPPIMLRRAKNKTQFLFTKQLGEALVIMGNAVRGGFSFRQSMDGVAKDMAPPISTEFAKTIREINYGVSMEQALNNMTARVKNPDLDLLVCAVLISSQVGGNMSDMMDTIASTIKDRIRIKQEIRVLTASGRMSSMVIGLLPVFIILILMVISPAYFRGFFNTMAGVIMAVGCVIMEMIGFFLIRRISDVKY
jgi:tight adherence protein B